MRSTVLFILVKMLVYGARVNLCQKSEMSLNGTPLCQRGPIHDCKFKRCRREPDKLNKGSDVF